MQSSSGQPYYATVFVTVSGTTHEVDARPSDALNLALRVGAPIFVAQEVMDRAKQATHELEPPRTRMVQAVQGQEPLPPAEWRSLTTLPLFNA